MARRGAFGVVAAMLAAIGIAIVGAVVAVASMPADAPATRAGRDAARPMPFGTPVPTFRTHGAGAAGIPSGAVELEVESVHDGDTLRARARAPNAVVPHGESTRVRLIGLDAPEVSPGASTDATAYASVEAECGADAARQLLAELAPPGTTVWATPDREAVDVYGRSLLYLWTPDGRFVNAELLAAGAGPVLVVPPNDRYEELFRMREAEASAAGAGFWGAC